MKKADHNDNLGSEKENTEKEPLISESTEADSPEIRSLRILKAILEDPKTLQSVPEEVRISIAEAASFSGPLPPPSMLESYEKTIAGSADRILRMAEKEQDHRIDWENTALQGNISYFNTKEGSEFSLFNIDNWYIGRCISRLQRNNISGSIIGGCWHTWLYKRTNRKVQITT